MSSQPKPSYLETLAVHKPESFEPEVFTPAKRPLGRWLLLGCGLLLMLSVAAYVVWGQRISVPDMSGWRQEQVQSWSKNSHITLELTPRFDGAVPKGQVISQSPSAGTKVPRSQRIVVQISEGADPEAVIPVPDFKAMTAAQLQAWISDNQLTNTTLRYESHETIPKDQLINFEFVDGDATRFLRKHRLNLYLSRGNAKDQAVVPVPDFIGKNQYELESWAQKHSITLQISTVFSDFAPRGQVVKQALPKDAKLNTADPFAVSVSRGRQILVPDFFGYTRQEASELATLMGLKVFFKYVQDDSYVGNQKGATQEQSAQERDRQERVSQQSISAGSAVDDSQIVVLSIDKASSRQMVPDFRGLTEQEAKALAQLMDLKVWLKNGSTGDQGTIAKQSHPANTQIDKGTVITLEVDGDSTRVSVPSFDQMNRIDAEIQAKNLGLVPVFKEVSHLGAAHNTVIGQSIPKSQSVAKGTSIRLDIGVNANVFVPDLTQLTRTEAELWASKQQVSLKWIERYHDKQPRGKLYDVSVKNRMLLTGEVIVIYYALGPLHVPDFVGKSKQEVQGWIDSVNDKGAEVTARFSLDYQSQQSRGTITTQSHYNESIPLNQELRFNVSALENKGLLVPDFNGLAASQLIAWCQQNNVLYSLAPVYSDTAPKDTLFGLNFASSYLSKDTVLRANQSLGKVFVPSFVGQSKQEVLSWLDEVNQRGGAIKVTFKAEDAADAVDTVLTQSTAKAFLPIGSSLQIGLSSGK